MRPHDTSGDSTQRSALVERGNESSGPPWAKAVYFLEVIEYHPVRRRSMPVPPAWLIGHVIITCLVAVLWVNHWLNQPWSPGTLAVVLALLGAAGVVLLIWAIPAGLYVTVSKWFQKWDWVVTFGFPLLISPVVMLSMGIVLLVRSSAAAQAGGVVGVAAAESSLHAVSNATYTAAVGVSYVLLLALSLLLMARAEVMVGLVSTRGRLRGAIAVLWAGTLIMMVSLVAVAVLLHSDELHWATVAIPGAIAIITSHVNRSRKLDTSLNALLTGLDEIRAAGLEAVRTGATERFFGAMRKLELQLDGRPRASAAAVRSGSLRALCRIADGMVVGRRDPEKLFEEHSVQDAARPLLQLHPVEFAFATAQVADGALRLIDRSYGPPMRRSLDVGQAIKTAPLPRPEQLEPR